MVPNRREENEMAEKIHKYASDTITVRYDAKRCIHAAECVRGLPSVFDTTERRWVQPENANADEVAAVVMRCPTGALHFERKDGGAVEAVPNANVIRARAHGPLYVYGDLCITSPEGNVTLQDTRAALCRCGASQNKPFCDNSHLRIAFQEAATWTHEVAARDDNVAAPQRLNLTPLKNAPLKFAGAVEIRNAKGETVFRGNEVSLCRCGASQNKPFCDGSHARVGFHED